MTRAVRLRYPVTLPFVMYALLTTIASADHAAPIDDCMKLAAHEWTKGDMFVWEKICEGKMADFNSSNGRLDPSHRESWKHEHRIISPSFLKALLSAEQLRARVPRIGVTIIGAHFVEEIDLSDENIPWDLCLCASRFENSLDISRLTADRSVILSGSFISGGLIAHAVRFSGDLQMREVKYRDSLRFPTILPKADLKRADIKGRLNMRGAIVGTINETTWQIEGGSIDLDSASIGSGLLMQDAKLPSAGLTLSFATVESHVDLSGSYLHSVDLTGATIAGELRLGDSENSPRVKWSYENQVFNYRNNQQKVKWLTKQAELIMHNAAVGVLVDTLASWRIDIADDCAKGYIDNAQENIQVDLDGFTYGRLGFEGSPRTPMVNRAASCFTAWLGLDRTFSPQPYRQLSSTLRDAGEFSKADDVLFEGKKRARKEAYANIWWKQIAQSLFGLTVGFGIKWHRAIWWAVGFIALGCVVLRIDKTHCRNTTIVGPVGIWFSVDYLLPIVKLNEAHFGVVDMSALTRIYFYVHQIVGYMLTFFVIAGLSTIDQ